MIISAALERGLTLADFQQLTMGQVVDYIITYNNMHEASEDSEKGQEEIVYEANQRDFDSF